MQSNLYFFYSTPLGIKLTIPQGVIAFHTIQAKSLDDVLPKLQGREFQLIGSQKVDDFLEACKIQTVTLLEKPLAEDTPKVDVPNKEEELANMAKYLTDNGYEINLKKKL